MNGHSPRPPSPAVVLALGLLTVPAIGCVITDTPQFQTPQHTRPFLLAATASPDITTVVPLNLDDMSQSVTFSAEVISQDDPAGSAGQFQDVNAFLYIDYGTSTAPGFPFRWPISGANTLEPSTLDQTSGRIISATWFPAAYPVPYGCHTATLVVSHLFDLKPCPRCDDDYSMLTWQVNACSIGAGTCGSLPLSGMPMNEVTCPVPKTNCDAADPPAQRLCPDATSAADAGASADAGTP